MVDDKKNNKKNNSKNNNKSYTAINNARKSNSRHDCGKNHNKKMVLKIIFFLKKTILKNMVMLKTIVK